MLNSFPLNSTKSQKHLKLGQKHKTSFLLVFPLDPCYSKSGPQTYSIGNT